MDIYYSPAELRHLIRQNKLRQCDISIACNVTQGQVSRLLNGKEKKPSSAYLKICIYVFNSISKISVQDISENKYLMGAISEVWDGTESQAKLLAKVIRSLAPLCKE